MHMKTITLLLCIGLILGSVTTKAQSVAINTTGASANGTSILDVSSTGKGILIPRMSSVQRTGIGTPANGLLVYDTDSIAFSYFNGVGWVFIKTGKDTATAWSTNGNAGITTSNFLGTTDNANIIFKRNNVYAGRIAATTTAFGVESAASANLFNTAFGYRNMVNSISGIHNTALGDSNFFYGSSGNNNIAIGSRNIPYVTGSNNIGIGSFNFGRDLYAGQNFMNNIAIGTSAQNQQWHGFENIAMGTNALYNDTTGNNNIAIGYHTLEENLSGYNNIGLGRNAANKNTTGYSNIAIGAGALYKNTNRNNVVAIGDSALYNNGTGALGAAQGSFNVAIGSKALFKNTTGYANTANGSNALHNNSIGFYNTANGNDALFKNTTGSFNIANGTNALYYNTTGSYNIANGTNALYVNTSGSYNVANGHASLFSNSTGSHNIAIGYIALQRNDTGSLNTAIGDSALYSNTASENTALGAYALGANFSGTNNVAVGVQAGNSPANDNGFYNTYIGDSTMMLADRTNSTVIGSKAYTTTNNSMVLGSINGVNGATADVKVGIGVTNPAEKLEIGNGRLRFRGNAPGGNAHGITWTNNAGTTDRAFIGMETDNFLGIYNFGFPPGWNIRIHNSTGEMGINKQPGTTPSESRLQVKQTTAGGNYGIGIEAAINANRWDVWLDNLTNSDYNFSYNGTFKGYIQNSTGNYIVVSDKRFKKDISDFSASLSNINQLKTYQYHYLDNSAADPFIIGFMAQDVQKLFPDAVSEKIMDDGKKRLGVNYQYFTVLAIKGLQEQQGNIESQNKKIEVLETQVAELKKLVEASLKK